MRSHGPGVLQLWQSWPLGAGLQGSGHPHALALPRQVAPSGHRAEDPCEISAPMHGGDLRTLLPTVSMSSDTLDAFRSHVDARNPQFLAPFLRCSFILRLLSATACKPRWVASRCRWPMAKRSVQALASSRFECLRGCTHGPQATSTKRLAAEWHPRGLPCSDLRHFKA